MLFHDLFQRYERGENIIEFLKKNSPLSLTEIIQISYDLQSGSYIQFAKENADFLKAYTTSIANLFSDFKFKSLMEVGCGEATTLANVAKGLSGNPSLLGFDISFSRLLYAQKYSLDLKNDKSFFLGDLFNIPLKDNSVDLVYTSHSIEPNGGEGRERKALAELYRITNKYLVLLEPSYEFGGPEARARMERHGYVKGLDQTAKDLGFKVIEHRLFDHYSNPLNPTGLIVIEKTKNAMELPSDIFQCPITKSPLKKNSDCFSTESRGYVYPIIKNIPCLLEKNAIIASHYNSF